MVNLAATPVPTQPPPLPPADQQPLLRVAGLTVRFGALQVLDGVDLAVRPGELLAVAGENGAGKSTLVRCVVGDLAPTGGHVLLRGHRVVVGQTALRHPGVGVVWQTPAQCDNLDVAANLMLGAERRWMMRSERRNYAAAAQLLDSLGIEVPDVSTPMQSLSRSQQQLIAIARAVRDRPALLVLDEPTGSLGVTESDLVERLIERLHRSGSTILLVSHDVEQMMRLADRIAVLRRGSVVAEVDPALSHPDDVTTLVAGQQVDSSARRQLLRLRALVDQLASSDASSGLSLILTALGAALGADRLCLHLAENGTLRLSAALGLTAAQRRVLDTVPSGAAGGPVGVAALNGSLAVDLDGAMRSAAGWPEHRTDTRNRTCYAVPVVGASELLGVITVFRSNPGAPQRDELDLAGLYAGYVASAVERDRLLAQLTARNGVLETIRIALQALTGPAALEAGLSTALQALREGTRARSVLLLSRGSDGVLGCLARADSDNGARPDPGDDEIDGALADLVAEVADPERRPPASTSPGRRDGEASDSAHRTRQTCTHGMRAVAFTSPGGPAVLVARWAPDAEPPDDGGLLEDAAQCLRLAFERQAADNARQQAAALRRSQHLQRDFLSRLSHELRTPLTAIRGYASSLTQPDVTWDSESQHRFVSRISAESDRLGRLVGDLLDFSAIESGIMRLHRDWCDLPLVLEAARACVPPDAADRVHLRYGPELPAVWADHDRLEQVFVNLIDNAVRHNPPGTEVIIDTSRCPGGVAVTVTDDGQGFPEGSIGIAVPPGSRSPASGSGLGLSITRGIVQAHQGSIIAEPVARGTRLRVELPEDPRTDDTIEESR
jgi:signal transduction histidine kinase/ABC-type branched-subunit amino acid transport system ATPase component